MPLLIATFSASVLFFPLVVLAYLVFVSSVLVLVFLVPVETFHDTLAKVDKTSFCSVGRAARPPALPLPPYTFILPPGPGKEKY